MEYRDKEFEITLNVNCPDEIGFLHHNKVYGLPDSAICVGGFQRCNDGFEVSIDKLLDEYGSDSWVVDTVSTIEEAKALLWEYRYHAGA